MDFYGLRVRSILVASCLIPNNNESRINTTKSL